MPQASSGPGGPPRAPPPSRGWQAGTAPRGRSACPAARRGRSGGWDRVALVRPFPVLALRPREPAYHLGPQVLRLDDRVDDHLGGEVQEVDPLGVLGHKVRALRRPLLLVLDRRELVEED